MLVKSVGASREFLLWEVNEGIAREAQIAMADVLVERQLTDQYGIAMVRERGGWTLYLVSYKAG